MHQGGRLRQNGGAAPVENIADKLRTEIVPLPAFRDPAHTQQRSEYAVSIDSGDPLHVFEPFGNRIVYIVRHRQREQGAFRLRVRAEETGTKRLLDKPGRQRTCVVLSSETVKQRVGQREGDGGVCVACTGQQMHKSGHDRVGAGQQYVNRFHRRDPFGMAFLSLPVVYHIRFNIPI